MKLTIKQLIEDITTPTGYRDKETGRFVSYKDVELFKEVAKIKVEAFDKYGIYIPNDIAQEIDDLEKKFDDDDYESPHEFFKIKYPYWDELSEKTLKGVARKYFNIDKRKGNLMAMEYTLAKLKIDQLYRRL